MKVILALMMAMCVCGCVSPISEVSQKEGFARIQEREKDEKWEILINEAQEFRARYPYSEHRAMTEMSLGNAQFQLGRYAEAIVTYEEYRKKYLKEPSRELATYRIAESYFMQSSDVIDREQDYSRRALNAYSAYLDEFPTDKNAVKAKEQIRLLSRRLAEHEVFVGQFYARKENWSGVVSRFLKVIKDWPQFEDLTTIARQQASIAYKELANLAQQEPKSDASVFFKNETPESLRKKAEEVLRGTAGPKP